MEEFYKSFYFYHISHLHFRMSAKILNQYLSGFKLIVMSWHAWCDQNSKMSSLKWPLNEKNISH